MTDSAGYAVLVRPLPPSEGGGYVATVPDLPGCMSDGQTVQEAVENVQGAIESWTEAAEELGRPVPEPGSASGQWRQRVPKTLHVQLRELAQAEGVSLNALVSALLAESVGRRLARKEQANASVDAIAPRAA
ncbi:MAG: type II toxin-antitoxin system HicB family antitoxin [Alphaproteobacteria bacterium]